MSLIREDDPPAVVGFIVVSVIIACVLVMPRPAMPAVDTPAPVAVRVEYGPHLPSHGTARLRVTVEPHAWNRYLMTTIDSENPECETCFGRSDEELFGARSPKTRWVEFKDISDGAYTASVRLLREHEEPPLATATFTVGAVGIDAEFP